MQSGKSSKVSSKKSVDFAEEPSVVFTDEFAEVELDDPTFGGLRENAMDEAKALVVECLKVLHRQRYHHSPPADPVELFQNLQEEIDLPYEKKIKMLLTGEYEEKHEASLLKTADAFVRKVR